MCVGCVAQCWHPVTVEWWWGCQWDHCCSACTETVLASHLVPVQRCYCLDGRIVSRRRMAVNELGQQFQLSPSVRGCVQTHLLWEGPQTLWMQIICHFPALT